HSALYTLSLHDALPILDDCARREVAASSLDVDHGASPAAWRAVHAIYMVTTVDRPQSRRSRPNLALALVVRVHGRRSYISDYLRSEEHTSELQSQSNLV